MKKLFAFLLVMTLALSFSACGRKREKPPKIRLTWNITQSSVKCQSAPTNWEQTPMK